MKKKKFILERIPLTACNYVMYTEELSIKREREKEHSLKWEMRSW